MSWEQWEPKTISWLNLTVDLEKRSSKSLICAKKAWSELLYQYQANLILLTNTSSSSRYWKELKRTFSDVFPAYKEVTKCRKPSFEVKKFSLELCYARVTSWMPSNNWNEKANSSWLKYFLENWFSNFSCSITKV